MKIQSANLYASMDTTYIRQEQLVDSIRVKNSVNSTDTNTDNSSLDSIQTLDAESNTTIKILEQLMGKKISISSLDFKAGNSRVNGVGMELSQTYSMYEKESLDFNSSGVVRSEDGREMSFSLSIKFSREFTVTSSSTLDIGGGLFDPLVVSFDNSTPIGSDRFEFDLIGDEELENIPYLSENSGFLTLDKNGDGIVNNGSELFGPTLNSGFKELMEYDEDHNGWIDENDSIFRSLKVWMKSEDKDQILSLKEVGIGAISLNAIEGRHDFKDSSNTTLAQIDKTSLVLGEDGQASALFELNLSV
jgi:hypothetical protein